MPRCCSCSQPHERTGHEFWRPRRASPRHQRLAKPTLLDSYDAERLPVIEGMLQIALDLLTRLFKAATDPADIWDRGDSQDQQSVNYRDTPHVFDERAESAQVNSVRTHTDEAKR
ncbi:hypothetical protein BDN71DRAFT_1445088 [Pleurotus eryngii]|uniref:Uncharacterized protein n=1 Tax=Pleurotus eryngii TaxID=5323 RepID=A0A9P6A4J3_PLEER|nr:hypothetical protein BDN71DRAFT_1445088 [Pleurotus eryngii]